MNFIEYVENKDISAQQWDSCIKRSFNGSIEAYSWYLNLSCDHWDAFIEGDYNAVMPLPVKRKLGQPMVYLPPFINQLGIYSPDRFTLEKTTAFLTLLKKRFRLVDLCLNKYTPIRDGDFPVRYKMHYELDLIRPYSKIMAGYSLENRNRLHIATAKRYSVVRSIPLNDLMLLMKREKIKLDPDVRKDDNKLLRMLVSSVIRFKTGELYGAYNEVNMLSCVSLFVWSHNEVIMLLCAATDEALNDNAHLLLYDQFIEKNAEINTTIRFHFVNSAHPARVYAGFGATESQSRRIQINNLPFFLRLFY